MTDEQNSITIWDTVKEYLMTSGLRLVKGIVLVVIGFIIIDTVSKKLKASKLLAKAEPGAQSFIFGFVSIALKAVVLVAAAAVMGVPMTSIVALVGSCGLAIGLSLQGSLSNLAGGLMMLVFKPFAIGDYIETPSGDGIVTRITILYTYLRCRDNTSIVIPNGSLANSAVKNCTPENVRRATIRVGVAYTSNITQVKKALVTAAKSCDFISTEHEPQAEVEEYADSSINMVLYVWVNSHDYWKDVPKVREEIKRRFDIDGISIPFPQLDVHFDNSESQQ